jgi:hypothetical protein
MAACSCPDVSFLSLRLGQKNTSFFAKYLSKKALFRVLRGFNEL